MTIFFTRVFTGRYTLHEKSTKASQKSFYWPNIEYQNQYFHRPSVKNQKQKFLLWPWNEVILGNLRPQEALAQRIKATCTTKNVCFDSKVEGAHSFGIILNVPVKVNFTKLCTGKSVLFEWLVL